MKGLDGCDNTKNKLTAVVRYWIPYLDKDGKYQVISFGLGERIAEHTWNRGKRFDKIKFEESKHATELNKGLRVSDKVSAEIKQQVKNIVIKFWDSFCEEGTRQTII